VLSCPHSDPAFVDDLHFIDPNRRELGGGVPTTEVAGQPELPVTYSTLGSAWPNVGSSRGPNRDQCRHAQTRRRWTRLELPPFHLHDGAGRRAIGGQSLKATERQLRIAGARPGQLTELDGYLFARSSGAHSSFQ